MANPTLTIRIPPELKESATRAAGADDRTLTEFTCRALRLAIAMGPVEVANYFNTNRGRMQAIEMQDDLRAGRSTRRRRRS